ncbi:MAG: CPBP family glutamic-type intramembrane protease [Treponema sp.]|nr:CPBP family glutamic-type intramembrane protease [Treponema sp.]
MGIYIEAIILYILLFFSVSAAQILGAPSQAQGFSVLGEALRIVLNIIPSLALIWYLLIKTWKIDYWGARLGKKDLISGFITYPCLLLIGSSITLISIYIGGTSKIILHSPSTAAGWAVLSLSCLLAAYLEESFFRFYLLSKRKELNLSASSALAFSVILFSVCHIYAGPWSFLNAVISGTFLGFMFLRYNSLHGIAIAHGLYNITLYILNAILN